MSSPDRKQNSYAEYGSDVIADLLKALDFEYVTFNPGASFSALHDSLVNHGGNQKPKVVLCCHEGVVIDIARGYNIVAPRPMLAIVHNLVGLLNANMAIFNAWVDRAPVLVLGATGPMDAEKRRPWIDWIHTAIDQGNVVRDYVKWDNHSTSLTGMLEAIRRGYRIAMTEPKGPVYVCMDSSVQLEDMKGKDTAGLLDTSRFSLPSSIPADPEEITRAAQMLLSAERPVIVAFNLARKPKAFQALIELAKVTSIPVIDGGVEFSFPTDNPMQLTGAREELLAEADLILGLDIFDLELDTMYANLSTPLKRPPLSAKIIDISLRDLSVRGYAEDYGRYQPVDLDIMADTSLAIPALTAACREMLARQPGRNAQVQERFTRIREKHAKMRADWKKEAEQASPTDRITPSFLAAQLWEAVRNEDFVLVNNTTNFDLPKKLWDISSHHQYVGGVGGGGIGFGIGRAIGVALANLPHQRLCVDIQPDGDLLYTSSGLWTMANQQIPMLVVMYNNRSYFNTTRHQGNLARERNRPEANKGIGTALTSPNVDFAKLAESYGIHGQGPVEKPEALRKALEDAVKYTRENKRPALVDVVISMQ